MLPSTWPAAASSRSTKYPHLKLPTLPFLPHQCLRTQCKRPVQRRSFLLSSDLCPRDRRKPEGQVSSLRSVPFQNFCSDFVWENGSGKLGLETRTAWPIRGDGLSPGAQGLLLDFLPRSPAFTSLGLSIRGYAEIRPSLPGPGTTALWCSLPPEAPPGCHCFPEGHPGPRCALLSPTKTPGRTTLRTLYASAVAPRPPVPRGDTPLPVFVSCVYVLCLV